MDQTTAYPWDPPDDVVVFETPEQTEVEHTLAPFGTRLVAAALDGFVVVIVVVLLGVLVAVALGSAGVLRSAPSVVTLLAAIWGSWGFALALYHTVFELRWQGQTWGKRVTGIRVVLTTGQGLTLSSALIRNLSRLFDVFPLMWLVPTLSEGRRRMGDLLGGTYVVLDAARKARLRKLPWPAASYAELEERQFYFGEQLAARLFRDDLNLIEYLMVRERAQPPKRRLKLLRVVANRYVARLGLEGEDRDRIRDDPRRFFEELALFLKSRFEGQAY